MQPGACSISFYRAADDFTLAAASNIDAVRFWMVAMDQSFGGTLSYAFYQDSNGALGSLITSGSISNVTPLFLPQITGFVQNTYQVDFSLPSTLNLPAGTYWLEVHDGATLTTNTAPTPTNGVPELSSIARSRGPRRPPPPQPPLIRP